MRRFGKDLYEGEVLLENHTNKERKAMEGERHAKML
jgi:hypothetical protein